MKLNQENIEDWILLYVDRELSPKQEVAFFLYLKQNPQYETLLKEYEATRLRPDTAVFPNKDSLIQPERIKKPLVLTWKIAGIAASIALFLGIGIGYWLRFPQQPPSVSQGDTVVYQRANKPKMNVLKESDSVVKNKIASLQGLNKTNQTLGLGKAAKSSMLNQTDGTLNALKLDGAIVDALPLDTIKSSSLVAETKLQNIFTPLKVSALPSLVITLPNSTKELLAKLDGDDTEDSKWPEASGIVEQFSTVKKRAKLNFLSLKKTTFVLLIGNKEVPIIK